MFFVEREVSGQELLFLEGEAGGRAGGGEDEPADTGVDGRFKDIDCADHIDVQQLRRRRAPRPRYGREMDHGVLVLAGAGKLGGLHDVAPDETRAFHPRRGAAEACRRMARPEQLSQDISADGAAASGYEDSQHPLSPSSFVSSQSSCTAATCHQAGPTGFSSSIGLMKAAAFSRPSRISIYSLSISSVKMPV